MTKSYEQAALVASLVVAVVCLVLPLIIVSSFDANAEELAGEHAPEITVGIAVILRATARRLLRSGAKGALRTTAGTFSRTVARTVTRRVVRVVTHSLVGVFTRRSLEESLDQASTTDAPIAADDTWGSVAPYSLVLGVVALSFSFWGVLHVVPDSVRLQVLSDGQLGVLPVCLIAGVPLLVFGVVTLLLACRLELKFRYVTEIDGLLIQAYFTGAGSFLPVTTDFESDGPPEKKARLAFVSLTCLYTIHLLLLFLAWQTGSELLHFSSGMFLVYCFVYSFPIAPLQGYDVWSFSKGWWLAMFTPILASFLFAFPHELSQII